MELILTWFSSAEPEYLLRVILAAVCGGIIGYEREKRFKSAGIRTHLIVALSAALMMVVSKYGFFDVVGQGGVSLDASRVAAGVVTAIGFLGAGVIFVRKETVSGVTTAAGLWATVGVGIAVGAGLYFTGVAVTAVILLMQVLLHRKSRLVRQRRNGTIVLAFAEEEGAADTVHGLLESMVDNIDGVSVKRTGDGTISVTCEVSFSPDSTAADLLEKLRESPLIRSVEMRTPG